MKKRNKAAAIIIGLLAAICGFSFDTYAKSAWDIENTLDVSECKRGDTITMSVKLKGSDKTSKQDIISMEGVLEYDVSLFTVEKADILPVESGKVQSYSFNPSTGSFAVQYSSAISVKDAGLMMQIRLHTAADATIGKTTLCVTQMKWNGPSGQQAEEIEHRIPASVQIAKAQKIELKGDVNRDGKVNLTDAKLVIRYFNGKKKLSGQQKENADVNGDGKVNLTDAKLIIKYYNGEIDEF